MCNAFKVIEKVTEQRTGTGDESLAETLRFHQDDVELGDDDSSTKVTKCSIATLI
jgi:hypothetical protein